jgi:protocatechuate 3,4-dioxygenase beta subunit
MGLASLPLVKLAACGGTSSAQPDASASDDSGLDDAAVSEWARGGTAAMTDKASYPNPFTGAPASCVVVASTTLGPCTTVPDLMREDVSEGLAGIPVRLALKVVDAACNPVVGATVKIWHTNIEGVYSGQTPRPDQCSRNNATYIAMDFMRGAQITNAAGVVYFDTCYPGWYPGRAIHIHFQVKNADTTYRVSQLFFPDELTRGIFTSHLDYRPFGQPNTTLANDGVVAPITGAARDRLVCEIARMTDGAMLASKTITVL